MKTKESFIIEKADPSKIPTAGRKKREMCRNLELVKVGQALRYRGPATRNHIYTTATRIGYKFSIHAVEGGFDCYRIALIPSTPTTTTP